MKEKKEQKEDTLLSQLLKYGVAGVFNTILGFVILYVQLELLEVNFYLANVINYGIGFFTNFYLNRKFTFKSDGSAKKEMKVSILVYLASYALQFALITYLKDEQSSAMIFCSELGYKLTPEFVISIVGEERIMRILDTKMIIMYWGIVVFALSNFILNRTFTFKKKK